MPVDPAIPTSVPPIVSSEQDLDPDALEDEDHLEELKEHEHEQERRPEDWDEPPATAAPKLPEVDEPRLIRDDLN